MKDYRYKTVNFAQTEGQKQHRRIESSKPRVLSKKVPSQCDFNPTLSKTTFKTFKSPQFSNRDSGKFTSSPTPTRHKTKNLFSFIKSQARAQLQKATYSQKLSYIEQIFKTVRQLCKAYGYFYLTLAMVQIDCEDGVKISLWIHPDTRATKPLHPIKKDTDFESELACATEVKNIVKLLFPTVDLGNGRTFTNIIAYIQGIKLQLGGRVRRCLTKKQSCKTNENICDKTPDQRQSYTVGGSMKVITLIEGPRNCEETAQQQKNRKQFKVDQRHKETTSTLLSSIRSGNSMKDKLKSLVSSPNKTDHQKQYKGSQKMKHKTSVGFDSEIQAHTSQQKTTANQSKTSPERPKQIQPAQKPSAVPNMKQSNTNSKAQMKTSISGRRLMSMSIEIESEINNLFGSCDDMALSNYYARNIDMKNVRNSVLSRVAQQFQDLF